MRWPTTVTTNSNSLQQIQIHHGKFKFTAANSNSLRQIQIHHRKFKFATANSNSTPYNVSSVLWRLFSTLEVVQYIGGITSVLRGIASVMWGDNISTFREITSVLWRRHQYYWGYSVLWRDTFSTVRGITAVHVGDSFSTVEGIQYIGR